MRVEEIDNSRCLREKPMTIQFVRTDAPGVARVELLDGPKPGPG